MKKALAIILLIIGSSVSFFVQLVVNLFLVYPYIFPAVIVSAAAAFGTACFYKIFGAKVGINALLFWVSAFVPQFVFGLGNLIWAYCMEASGHLFFLGPQALLYFYDMPVTGAAYALFGGIWTVVRRAFEKRRALK